MKIDLGKELANSIAPPPRPPALLIGTLALCGLNAVLLLAVLGLRLAAAPPVTTLEPRVIMATDTQLVRRLELRLDALEQTLHDLRTVLLESKLMLKDFAASQKIALRRERLSGSSDERTTTKRALRWLPVTQPSNVVLAADEIAAFDALIDRDESGARVSEFMQSLTDASRRGAYLQHLQQKGDQWLAAALPLIENDDPSYEMYCDNALYFYNIIGTAGGDRTMLAYVQSKRNEIAMALQRLDARLRGQETETRLREELGALEERMLAERTNRPRRRIYGH